MKNLICDYCGENCNSNLKLDVDELGEAIVCKKCLYERLKK